MLAGWKVGFVRDHVLTCTRNDALLQSMHRRGFLDEAAARHVDETTGAAQGLQHIGIQHPLAGRTYGGSQGRMSEPIRQTPFASASEHESTLTQYLGTDNRSRTVKRPSKPSRPGAKSIPICLSKTLMNTRVLTKILTHLGLQAQAGPIQASRRLSFSADR